MANRKGWGQWGGRGRRDAYYVGGCSEVWGKIREPGQEPEGMAWAEGGRSLAWLVDPREMVGAAEDGFRRNPGFLVSM